MIWGTSAAHYLFEWHIFITNCLMWLFSIKVGGWLLALQLGEGAVYSLVIWLTSNELMVSERSHGLTKQLADAVTTKNKEDYYFFSACSPCLTRIWFWENLNLLQKNALYFYLAFEKQFIKSHFRRFPMGTEDLIQLAPLISPISFINCTTLRM